MAETSTNNDKSGLPSTEAVKSAKKRGGLGRGLASLIPTGPARPSLGAGAADVILGQGPSGGNQSAQGGAARRGGEGGTHKGATPTGVRRGSQTDYSDATGGEGSAATERSVNEGEPGTQTRGGTSPANAGRSGLDREPVGGPGKSAQNRTPAGGAEKSGRETADSAGTGDIGATYQELPLDSIAANAKQPRTVFDEEALQELVHSIREFGLMQPIVVRPAPTGDKPFELIMGERRLRAASEAGLETIPAIVRETEDSAMLRDALLENIHRVQLNPLEEAAAYQQLLEEFGVTQAQLAERIGRSRPLITNMIRLLQLPVSVQRRVGAGVLSSGHARALLGVKVGPEAQEALATRIVAEGLSVRATEEAVALLNRGDSQRAGSKAPAAPRPLPERVETWVHNVQEALDTKVKVQMGRKRGKIVVEFAGPEDFDRIVELLRVDSEG
ncbi:ParB/RepB/Spo0J family partition protein [Corynebacterium heidelbergense]|uniref:Chromosome partitioning protein ParB n=1 Tax=Corynebacterium heidelbergense TaxID=2055947 RepID=A0A364V883_9CORY|nr:ParB/RepB/Spo0J family partition protein [Corynebacterium heidelbergense]RAV32873.1 chromosome partitioning protein ParB [Corynebacterium heidelbergense]